MATYNAVSLANLAAAHWGLPEADKTAMHRSFRNMVDTDVLPTEVDEDNGRAPRLFPTEVAAVGLLLFPLTRLAVDARLLRRVAGYLLGNTDKGQPIQLALKAVSKGCTVDLAVILSADWQPAVSIRVEGDEVSVGAAGILSADRIANPLAAEIRVPVNLWVAPVQGT